MKYLDKLKSTTREERNIENLSSLFTYLDKEAIDLSQKKILVVGPGGIVESFSPFVPKGPKRNISTYKKILYTIVRQFESVLRKTGRLKLKSFEIVEILNLIKKGNNSPTCIYVADCEEQILNTIKDSPSNIGVKTLLWDIETGKANEDFDIIICYNVIQRLNKKVEGLQSIVDSTVDKGLLSLDMGKLDINLIDFGLTKLSDNLYQKTNG